MSRPYAINDASKAHFITAAVVDWIDVFTRKSYYDIVEENLNFYMLLCEVPWLRTHTIKTVSLEKHLS